MTHLPSKRFYSDEELETIAEGIEAAVTLPVGAEIDAEHRVYSMGEIERILRGSEYIYLQECGCRKMHGNCDSPLDTCLSVNVGADYAEENRQWNPRRLSVDEALAALRRSHDAGLVHMAYTFKGDAEPHLICSCCPCCCHTLGGLLRHGATTLVLKSRYKASTGENCTKCGACVKRCVFAARTMTEEGVTFDEDRCFGCGLCASACPEGNIKLVEKKHD